MGKIGPTFFVLGVASLLAAPGEAQDARLQRLLSEDFARGAYTHLNSCDRGNAIVAALRGLPADATDADMTQFSVAATALLHAVGSRAVRLPRDVQQMGSVSPDGSRIVVGDWTFDQGTAARAPFALYNPQDGSHVADLVSFQDGAGSGVMLSQPPVFSPDGSMVAVPVIEDASIRLFAATDGRELVRLEGLSASPGLGSTIISAGFDSTGARYAAFGIGSMIVWDTATGQQIVHHDVPQATDPSIFPLGWDHRDRLLMNVRSDRRDDYSYATHLVEAWHPDSRRETVLDLSSLEIDLGLVQSIGVSRFGPALVAPSDMASFRILDMNGASLGTIPMGWGVAVFTPDGAGVTAWTPGSGSEPIMRVSLQDGVQVPADPKDRIPFLHHICGMGGEQLGTAVNGFGNATYTGADLPTGKALYDFVWTNLPQTVRDAVGSDRIAGE